MYLSKSYFKRYLESPLHLWATTHDAITIEESPYSLHLATQGQEVEKLAKQMLAEKVTREYPPGSTIEFEVSMSSGNYMCRLDALVHDVVHNTYDVYEIKSGTSIKAEYEYDVTFQYLIAYEQLPLYKTYLVRVNNTYIRQGAVDLQQLFTIDDMSPAIEKLTPEVLDEREKAWEVMNLVEAPLSEHCLNPSKCDCPLLCFPELPEYPIFDLCRVSKDQYQRLLAQGVQTVKDIPETFGLTYKQQLQVQSAKSGQPILNTAAIKNQLDGLQFPLYFLDYETFGPAVPLLDGYAPYQNIVFQYSLHVVESPDDDEIEHFEFLATDQSDPCGKLVEDLAQHIGPTGTVISWSKSFECGRNKEMAAMCPQFAEFLLDVNARMYDLMDIFMKGYYVDYRFHGSSSIKNVLPILCPELSYKELDISEGTTAMTKWHEMVHRTMREVGKEKVKSDLLRYCELDTWAMVKIWRRVRAIEEQNNLHLGTPVEE